MTPGLSEDEVINANTCIGWVVGERELRLGWPIMRFAWSMETLKAQLPATSHPSNSPPPPTPKGSLVVLPQLIASKCKFGLWTAGFPYFPRWVSRFLCESPHFKTDIQVKSGYLATRTQERERTRFCLQHRERHCTFLFNFISKPEMAAMKP